MEPDELVIVIKGDGAKDLTEAICSNWRYREKLSDGSTNPESKNRFAIRKIKGLLSKITELHHARKVNILEVSQE